MRNPDGDRRTGRLVRPYTMTGGRTGAEFPEIAFEAHVTATEFGLRISDQLRWEAEAIVDRASNPMAVVELAAALTIPIGVVRVLAGDLAEMGAVSIANPASEVAAEGGERYTDLLQQVVDGIKSL